MVRAPAASVATPTTTSPFDWEIRAGKTVAPVRIGATHGVAMTTRTIPAADVLVAHEQAALEVGELRRKGIHCHLEEHAGPTGCRVEVVRDFEVPVTPRSQGTAVRGPRPGGRAAAT